MRKFFSKLTTKTPEQYQLLLPLLLTLIYTLSVFIVDIENANAGWNKLKVNSGVVTSLKKLMNFEAHNLPSAICGLSLSYIETELSRKKFHRRHLVVQFGKTRFFNNK